MILAMFEGPRFEFAGVGKTYLEALAALERTMVDHAMARGVTETWPPKEYNWKDEVNYVELVDGAGYVDWETSDG